MERKNKCRRTVLKTLGTGVIGIAGLASSTLASEGVAPAGDLEWIVSEAVEGDNTVDLCMSVGYFGSELQTRWIGPGNSEDRWVHFFEANMVAMDTADGSYNISGQEFDTRMLSDTEHNGSPIAGSTAWPYPESGNWDSVTKEILEGGLGIASNLFSFGSTADNVIDAYGSRSFDTTNSDKISFETSYAIQREKASHHVNFTADQPPDSNGMVDVLCVAEEILNVSGSIYLYPESDNLPKPEHYDEPTSLRTADTAEKSEYRKMLDAMSDEELAEYGVKRVDSSDISIEAADESKRNLQSDHPSYITSFDFDVEYNAENGNIVDSKKTMFSR